MIHSVYYGFSRESVLFKIHKGGCDVHVRFMHVVSVSPTFPRTPYAPTVFWSVTSSYFYRQIFLSLSMCPFQPILLFCIHWQAFSSLQVCLIFSFRSMSHLVSLIILLSALILHFPNFCVLTVHSLFLRYPESKLRFKILPRYHCRHAVAHARPVCWFLGKKITSFANSCTLRKVRCTCL